MKRTPRALIVRFRTQALTYRRHGAYGPIFIQQGGDIRMRNLPPLPKFPGYTARQDDTLRFKTCDVCGQSFDTNNPDHVFHHGPELHEPLKSA